MPAGEDRIIYAEEDTEVRSDIELYEARSKISDNPKYERLKRRLRLRGFNFIKHGKNKSLDGIVDSVEIKLSHNYKLNRHRFEFVFPKEFVTMDSYLFIHKFLKKTCMDNPDDYAIGMVASSEFGIDEKKFPPGLGLEYILNLVKASKKSRSKFDLFVQFRDEFTKKLIKIYLKDSGTIVRTETKGRDIEAESKLIEKYKTEKDAMLDTELQDQIWRDLILSILESIETKTENNALYQDLYADLIFQQSQRILQQSRETNENIDEMKEDIITIFYQLDQLRYREQKDNEILANQTEILSRMADNQERMINTQTLLINETQLLKENLSMNQETLFHQNRELETQVAQIDLKLSKVSLFTKVKDWIHQMILRAVGRPVKKYLRPIGPY